MNTIQVPGGIVTTACGTRTPCKACTIHATETNLQTCYKAQNSDKQEKPNDSAHNRTVELTADGMVTELKFNKTTVTAIYDSSYGKPVITSMINITHALNNRESIQAMQNMQTQTIYRTFWM